MGNVTDVALAGMVTLDGTVSSDVSLLPTDTVNGNEMSVLNRVRVPVKAAGPAASET